MRSVLFVASNLAIVAGYFFMAAVVIPRVTIRLHRTRIGGIGFFLLCGLHHLENASHYLFTDSEDVRAVYESPHMLAIDVLQAFAVWAFVTGLYLELVRWGPWGTEEKT